MIIPTCEAAISSQKNNIIGILATQSTVVSESYIREIHKLNPRVLVYQQAAPLLVSLIENNGLKWLDPILDEYLKPLIEKRINCLILGCTHYPIIKNEIRRKLGNHVRVISQDEIIPSKLQDYLDRHPEIKSRLSKNFEYQFLVTDLTKSFNELASQLFVDKINLKLIDIKNENRD